MHFAECITPLLTQVYINRVLNEMTNDNKRSGQINENAKIVQSGVTNLNNLYPCTGTFLLDDDPASLWS